MTALTEDVHVYPEEESRFLRPYPVAASTLIYGGALVAMNASGYAVPASADITLTVVGFARARADNSDGSAGDIEVEIDRAPARKVNSASTDEITLAHVGQPCYVVDDNTVALTHANGTRPKAGIVRAILGSYVLVEPDASATGSSSPGAVVLNTTINCATAFDDTDGAETIELGSLPAGVYVGYARVPTAVTGGGTTAAVLEVGWSGNNDGAIDGFSVFTTSGLVPRVSDTGTIFILSATTTITATLTTTDGNVADVSGTVQVLIRRIGQ